MPRKRYTQKGLATTVREAQARHRRLETERVRAEEQALIERTISGAEAWLADAAFDEATGEGRR